MTFIISFSHFQEPILKVEHVMEHVGLAVVTHVMQHVEFPWPTTVPWNYLSPTDEMEDLVEALEKVAL